MMRGIKGGKFIVTAAGSGIGQACAVRLAEEGAIVFGVDRVSGNLDNTAAMAAKAGGELHSYVKDVTEKDALDEILRVGRETLGTVDGLVNVVGLGNPKSAHADPDEQHDFYMNLNFRTTFRMCREFIKMNLDRGGSIVNIASTFGLIGFPGSATYSAAKAAVIGLTRQLAAEYGEYGFRFNAVAPGLIMTPAHTQERQDTAKWFYDSYIAGTPMRKAGEADDIGAGVTFLLSSDAKFITGQVLVIDGGWTITKYAFADDGRPTI